MASRCGCRRHLPKFSCSTFMPASKSPASTAASTHWMIISGAKRPRIFRAAFFRAASKISALPRSAATLSVRSRTRFLPLPSATAARAQARAPAMKSSPSMTSSTMPRSLATGPGMGSPERMKPRAFSAPTRRGRRCVPPAPGSRPSFTSGRPTGAFGAMTR